MLKGVKELHDSSPPLAHRDIKPENVLLHSDGVSPVLVDFGSMGPAEVRVTSRAQALGVQDEAATFRCETSCQSRGGQGLRRTEAFPSVVRTMDGFHLPISLTLTFGRCVCVSVALALL